jgi:hypothetical protein
LAMRLMLVLLAGDSDFPRRRSRGGRTTLETNKARRR